MSLEAPTYEDTAPLAPSYEDTTPDTAPSYEETQPLEAQAQPLDLGEKSSRFLAGAAKVPLQAMTAATRVAQVLQPQWTGLFNAVAKETGLGTTGELITELEGATARTEDEYGVDTKQNDRFISQLASGGGSVLASLPAGPFAPAVTALQMGEQGYEEADVAGGSELQKATSFIGNAAVGAVTEKLLGVPALLKSAKLAKIPENTFKSLVGAVTKQMAKSFVREGTQETLEQISQDAIAAYVAAYDPDREVFNGKKLLTTFAIGGLLGAPVGGLVQAAESLSKEVNQQEAAKVDQSLATAATSEPPQPAPALNVQQAPQDITALQQSLPTEPTTVAIPTEPTPVAIPTEQTIPTPTSTQGEPNAVQEQPTTQVLRDVPEQSLGSEGRMPAEEGTGRVPPGGIREEAQPQVPNEAQGNVTADQAARTFQPFFREAVEVARKAGASDPELAASTAQEQLSRQVEQGTTTLENPRALLMEAAKRQAFKKPAAPETTAPESVTTRGPRAEMVSEEDVRTIDSAIEQLPESQSKVMTALKENPDLTDQELADQVGLTLDQTKKAKQSARNALKQLIIDQGLGRSLGPGAASVDEVLAVYEERKFGKQLQKSELEPEIKKDIGDRYYEVIPNRVSAKKATELIEQHGEENIESQVKDTASDLSYADRSTVAQILIKRYNEQFKTLKTSDPVKAEQSLTKAVELSEWTQDYLTKLGQGTQAAAMFSSLTPEGQLKTVQRMVTKKRNEFTRNNRTDIDEIKDIVNSDQSKAEKIAKIKRLKTKVARQVKSKAQKIVEAGKAGKLTDKEFFDAAGDSLGLPVFSNEVAKEILRLADLADQAPEGMPKMEATLNLNKYIAQQKGFNPGDLPLGIYYGNILSGGWTQAINLVDTALNVLNEVNTLAIQNPKASAEILSAMGKGFASGRHDSLVSLMNGRRISSGKFVEDPFLMEVSKFGEKGGVPIKTGTKTSRAVKAIAEFPAFKWLRAYKYIGRVMSASDALSFRAAQEAKSAQLAWQMANEPNSPSIEQILGYDRLPEFRQQAKSEGYTGSQAEARATELMIMSRPEEIQKASSDFAGEATYNVKPYGYMGLISNAIEGVTRKVPAAKIVVPFTRIVGNVVNRGLNNSPWGYFRAIRGKSGTALDPQTLKTYSPEERNALLVRATVSTALLSSLVLLHSQGVLTIHGAGPSDPEKKKQLRQTGWKPYTIQIGDKYYSYTYTPWGLAMAATGNYLDNEKYNDFSSKQGADRFAYAFQSIASTVFNQSFLSGLSTVFDIVAGKAPAQQISSFRRFTANTVSSFAVPFSSALKDLESIATNPNVPQITNLNQAIIANIPFVSQGLKPQLNAFGEPIKSMRNRLFSQQGDDPVWKFVADKGVRVPVPNTFFDSPDTQYEYLKEQGQLLKKWMTANLPRLKAMDSKQAQHAIERASDSFRERTRNKYMLEGAEKKKKR